MSRFKNQQTQLPMLLFFLENHKYRQIIKTIFNQRLSTKLLQQYGHEFSTFSKLQQFEINKRVQDFSIQDVIIFDNQAQLIQIKGASYKKIKRYQNRILIETILRRLKVGEVPTKQCRKLLWLQFTEIFVYDQLYEGLEDLQLPPDTESLLDKDIKRTYYNLQDYETPEQKNIKTQILRTQIKQVLSRFALYNPYLLYCQGINQVVGFFHEQGFTPKQIFFIFKRITQVILPTDYYSSLQGITNYLKILWQMVSIKYPRIHSKLTLLMRQLDISGSYLCVFSYCLQWFVCLFTNTSLNRQIRRTIFDYLLLEGITVLFKASLAIIEFLEPTILSVSSFEQYVTSIDKKISQYSNVQHLLNKLNTQFISQQILFLYAQHLTPPKQPFDRKFYPFMKKCNRRWNYCQQQIEHNMQEQYKYQFFVFKRKQPLKIIPDYIEKIHSYYFDEKKVSKPIDLMRIGRISHICNHTSETGTQDSLSQPKTRNQRSPSLRFSPTPKKKNASGIKIQIKAPSEIKQKQKSYRQSKDNNFIPLNQPRGFLQEQERKNHLFIDHLDTQYHRKQTLEQRQLIKKKLIESTGRNAALQRSESMMFMKMMVDNTSYSNLFSLLENEEMNKMFNTGDSSDSNSQEEEGNC